MIAAYLLLAVVLFPAILLDWLLALLPEAGSSTTVVIVIRGDQKGYRIALLVLRLRDERGRHDLDIGVSGLLEILLDVLPDRRPVHCRRSVAVCCVVTGGTCLRHRWQRKTNREAGQGRYFLEHWVTPVIKRRASAGRIA
nr:hypothetical protein [uncultured Rhodopila sp.]